MDLRTVRFAQRGLEWFAPVHALVIGQGTKPGTRSLLVILSKS